MIQKLHLIHCESSLAPNAHEVLVQLIKNKLQTNIIFTVKSKLWNTNDSFHEESSKNWGLWNHDVVEVFWQNRTSQNDINAPYYEWQCAPNHKSFCLEIFKPRISYATPLKCPIQIKSQLSENLWKAEFIIPSSLYSQFPIHNLGICAILGPENERCYYSLNIKPTKHPNFHLPEFFLPISELA